MKKILYVSYVRYGGGDWVHTREFLAAMGRTHTCLETYLPRAGQGALTDSSDSKVPASPKADPFRELRYLAALLFKEVRAQWRLLRRTRPALVIMRTCRYASLIPLCRLSGIPILLEINAAMSERQLLGTAERFRGIGFWTWLEARWFNMADHLFVVSAPLKRHFVKYGVDARKISVVPNGVDTRRFGPHVSGEAVRRAHNLTGKVVIGFAGSFTPWHGFDFLIDTVQALVSECPELQSQIALLLVGKSSEKALGGLPAGLTTVVTGHVPHDRMPHHLAAMDIITAPYPPIDPFYFSPLKIFEAMAMGKAVVASAQGQICDLITHGKNGMLYPPGDPSALKRELARLITQAGVREKIGQNARRTMAETYTWQDNARRILEICGKLT